jgi:hypothetical protein
MQEGAAQSHTKSQVKRRAGQKGKRGRGNGGVVAIAMGVVVRMREEGGRLGRTAQKNRCRRKKAGQKMQGGAAQLHTKSQVKRRAAQKGKRGRGGGAGATSVFLFGQAISTLTRRHSMPRNALPVLRMTGYAVLWLGGRSSFALGVPFCPHAQELPRMARAWP